MKKGNGKSFLRRFRTVLLVVVCIIVPILGLIYIMQDRMMFYNVHCPESRSALQGRVGFSEVSITADRDKTYHGVMYRAGDGIAPLIIYFGGNGEVSYRHMLMREANDHWRYFEGFHYLFIDYEGYGLNSGRPHYSNMYEQALAVFDYSAALPYVNSDRIVVMGFSLGTGSAVFLAAKRPIEGLILAAPFASGHDLYNNVLPIFRGPMGLLVRQKFPSNLYAPDVVCPVLIVASHSDEIIPFGSSVRLSELFPDNVDIVALSDEQHNFVINAAGALDRVRAFLEGLRQ
jgi:fermentation-respiration switch protein FrsA (DUF1100 family)